MNSTLLDFGIGDIGMVIANIDIVGIFHGDITTIITIVID